MGDPHGLVEISVFLIVAALALPMLDQLSDHQPTMAALLMVLLVLPVPLWLASFRFTLPDWLVRVMVWHVTVAMVVVGATLAGMLALAALRWLR